MKKVIKQIRTQHNMQFFGINGSTATPGMAGGLELRWDGDKVIATHPNFPNEEKWVLPATIAEISWKLVKEESDG